MIINNLLYFFWYACLPQLPLVIRHKGADWLEGKAVSNLLFYAMRSKSTIGAEAQDYLKLSCRSACCFHKSSSSALGV